MRPDSSSSPTLTKYERIDWETWQPKETGVLCFIRPSTSPEQILLIRKKRGLGAGKINGPGGRLEGCETPEEGAIRETKEEVGLVPKDLEHVGILSFQFTNDYSLRCHVFLARSYKGDMIETDEALPFWHSVHNLPYNSMWRDDELWLPHMLNEKKFTGRFVFDDDTMLYSDVSIVPSLPRQ
ncbi:MAG: 8-oxo-dGTP diphosphatase [Verrucomicrobiota bacterium]